MRRLLRTYALVVVGCVLGFTVGARAAHFDPTENLDIYTWTGVCTSGCVGAQSFAIALYPPDGGFAGQIWGSEYSPGINAFFSASLMPSDASPNAEAFSYLFLGGALSGFFNDGVQVTSEGAGAPPGAIERFHREHYYLDISVAGAFIGRIENRVEYYDINHSLLDFSEATRLLTAQGSWDRIYGAAPPTPVPLPAALPLFLSALGLLGWLRFRARSA